MRLKHILALSSLAVILGAVGFLAASKLVSHKTTSLSGDTTLEDPFTYVKSGPSTYAVDISKLSDPFLSPPCFVRSGYACVPVVREAKSEGFRIETIILPWREAQDYHNRFYFSRILGINSYLNDIHSEDDRLEALLALWTVADYDNINPAFLFILNDYLYDHALIYGESITLPNPVLLVHTIADALDETGSSALQNELIRQGWTSEGAAVLASLEGFLPASFLEKLFSTHGALEERYYTSLIRDYVNMTYQITFQSQPVNSDVSGLVICRHENTYLCHAQATTLSCHPKAGLENFCEKFLFKSIKVPDTSAIIN